MDNDQLHDTLHQLHAEIQQVDSVDDETRAVLQDLAQDIQTLIARPSLAPGRPDHPMQERLRNSITHFEMSHPQLSDSISRVLDALVQLGV